MAWQYVAKAGWVSAILQLNSVFQQSEIRRLARGQAAAIVFKQSVMN
jgi:hypothetical protein